MLAHLISISTLVVVASTTCFDNGDKEIQGLCYKFVAQKLSYNDAVNWCHYQNPVTASFLAYVPNQFASNFLASYARTSFGQNDGNFWIGLSRATTSSPWKWDSGDSLQFTNFDSSQLGQNYAAESIVKSNWGTFSSDQKMNFVCSYNPSAPPTFVPNTAVPSTPTPTAGIPTTTTQNVPTTTDPSFCQHPQWTFTFLFAYSPGLNIIFYREIVSSVLNIATSNPENVFRDAYLDDPTDEVIRQPKDFSSFSADLASYAPYHQLSSPTSNLIKIIENFIPTAQETSEYSGKTSNWLENSFLLLLPKSLPERDSEDSDDLSAMNYTSFINRNVKVFIVMDQDDVSSETDDVRFRIFSKLTAATNGHFIVGDLTANVIDKIMQIGYESDLVFTRNIVNASASGLTREIGKWKTPRGLVNVTVTISESVITGNPGVPVELKLRFESPKSAAFEVDLLAFGDVYKNSNFHSTTIPSLLPDTTYTVSATYTSSSIHDLLIRFWMPRVYSQYTEFIDLDFYPTDPNDKEGAAMRMTVLNNCWQLARAEISISDCTGAQSRKYDVNQVSGVPIGTEGSYPKFAFVPFFCDKFTWSCVKGAEDKYDVQLVVGDFSISRSFQCLSSGEPINPNCNSTDSNGNVHCTRTTLPYKRGPTGRLTDCLDRGFLQFDSIDTQDYVCICDSGYEGVSCQN